MIVKNNGFLTIEQLQDQYLNGVKGNTPVKTTDGKSFQEILESTQSSSREVRFSKHAAQRLSNRNIELTQNQKERLQAGTAKASQKGIRESLVLVDQLAFIVNIPNNTVVTAMQQNETDENIFTNIDGAVII
ncbi:MAG: flagellar protein [Lachnospiraceae bacterium]|jgi:flagellar operon protein|nr:flagellar protein [Lachnospiraceae bacterium]